MKNRYKIQVTIAQPNGSTETRYISECGTNKMRQFFMRQTDQTNRAVCFRSEAEATTWKKRCEESAADDKTGYWIGSTWEVAEVTA